MTELVNLLDVIVETTNPTMPEGCDSWGLKSTAPDLITTRGFQWPFPGGSVRSDDNIDPGPHEIGEACPNHPGDGLCIATTWRGMRSGGHPARTLLLVAYASANILGSEEGDGKLRVKGLVHVVSLIDGEALVKTSGSGANLTGADLTGADLYGADLTGADLTGANLTGANLYGANLTRANLTRADLTRAHLTGANLTGANLTGAHLTRADLTGADLTRANLTRAHLTGAHLTGANLTGADLYGANLTGADLTRANLTRANLTGANLTGADNFNLPPGWKLTETGIAVRS